jgi:ribose 5-phosphate isomerase A
MIDVESEKRAAAVAAVREISDAMLLGLGTGSTAAYAVNEIARRIAEEGLRIKAVASSLATEALARQAGIPMLSFDSISSLDLAIDGADEIDSELRAIKGHGGALLREKVVGSAATRMIVAVDSTKPVVVLGRTSVPLEVLPFAIAFVRRAVEEIGGKAAQRVQENGSPYLTDQKNFILDVSFGEIPAAEQLAERLVDIPGLLEHGLFLSQIDAAYIARGDQIVIREREIGGLAALQAMKLVMGV